MKTGPRAIGDVLSELMAQRGYGRIQGAEAHEAAWREAAGRLAAQYTRAGPVRRGTLEVIVANSTLVQELGFQKLGLLKTLAQLLPEAGIKNIRFRVGTIE
jgi:predicted nucleic acid-binding Zn ribbon protein